MSKSSVMESPGVRRAGAAWCTSRCAAGLVSRVGDFGTKLILADLAHDLVRAIRRHHSAHLAALVIAGPEGPAPGPDTGLFDGLRSLAMGNDPIAQIASDALVSLGVEPTAEVALEKRCPVPVRPRSSHAEDKVGEQATERGALRAQPHDPWTDRAGIALMLHNNLNGEYTTMELLAECSYEHPDLELDVHERLLRQAADEARHARLFERALAHRGHRYGDFGVYTTSYELCHEFVGVEPGSKHELANRLLVRCSYQEALSLDDLAWQVQIRSGLGQTDLVELFDEVLQDEIHHVRNGHDLAARLCAGLGIDPLRERALAHDRHGVAERERHELWLAENWATMLTDIADPPVAPPMPRFRNYRDRSAAGIGLCELQQELCWD